MKKSIIILSLLIFTTGAGTIAEASSVPSSVFNDIRRNIADQKRHCDQIGENNCDIKITHHKMKKERGYYDCEHYSYRDSKNYSSLIDCEAREGGE